MLSAYATCWPLILSVPHIQSSRQSNAPAGQPQQTAEVSGHRTQLPPHLQASVTAWQTATYRHRGSTAITEAEKGVRSDNRCCPTWFHWWGGHCCMRAHMLQKFKKEPQEASSTTSWLTRSPSESRSRLHCSLDCNVPAQQPPKSGNRSHHP